jgi:hypothetical protein
MPNISVKADAELVSVSWTLLSVNTDARGSLLCSFAAFGGRRLRLR